MYCWFLLFLAVGNVLGHEVYFSERFPSESSIDKWISSTYNGENQGKFEISAGPSPVDAIEDLGLMTPHDAKFYGITRKLDKPFSSRGETLVLQYTVKYTKAVDCGGAYIKLTGSDTDAKNFHGETPYKVMFGPDICGMGTKKVHVIFTYGGKNHLIKKNIRCEDDLFTHLYTLIVYPTNKYAVKIDNKVVEEGNLEDDWDMVPPKKIDDPNVQKPSDWVDEEEIDDPDDKKPDDWDQPKTIPDANAKKPDDWDDEMDGEWERPQIDNPDYKGEWRPKRISNPKYKGPWVPPQIDNPEYKADPHLHAQDDIAHVGLDLWQVASGSVFDNILLTNSPAFAEEEGEKYWRKRFEAEQKADAEKQKTTEAPVTDATPDAEEKDTTESSEDTESHDEL